MAAVCLTYLSVVVVKYLNTVVFKYYLNTTSDILNSI